MIYSQVDIHQSIEELNQQNSLSSTIQCLLKYQKAPYFYFEWLESAKALRLLYSKPQVLSTTIRLYEEDSCFQITDLEKAEQIKSLQELAKPIFKNQIIDSHLVKVQQNPFSLLFLSEKNKCTDSMLALFQAKCESFFWKTQASSLSKEEQFLKTMFCEISRARRLSLPVSLILIECLNNESQKPFVSIFFQSLYNHILKNLRTYDCMAQLNLNQLGILLPHTSVVAAQEKAKELYWMLDSLDSTKIFKQTDQKIKFKVSVVEYPFAARDATHLMQMARQSLQQKKNHGMVVVEPSDGFQPDFIHSPSDHHLCEMI